VLALGTLKKGESPENIVCSLVEVVKVGAVTADDGRVNEPFKHVFGMSPNAFLSFARQPLCETGIMDSDLYFGMQHSWLYLY
jgi:hypothetical protein